MAFPTLKYKSISITSEDNSIKSNPQDGKVITRKRFTKTRKTITVSLPLLIATDLSALASFYDTVENVSSFTWTNPDTTNTHTVRFNKPLKYTKDAKMPDYYSVESLELIEV